jgi:hypothetical protein
MTQVEQVILAQRRAKAAGLRVRSTTSPNQFLVRSRSQGYDHVVHLDGSQVVACTRCPSFENRNVCIHMGALLNRLERKTQPKRRAAIKRWTDPLKV